VINEGASGVAKELLFSVTEADCDWQYDRGTGAGGQKRNKTSSKARCTHRASGAVGVDDTTRSQHQNKKRAFAKMAATKEFMAWWKLECARHMGELRGIDERVDDAMRPRNLKVEGKLDGKWTPIELCEQPEN
jgi:protein subunit release factor B